MDSTKHEQFTRLFVQHQGQVYGHIVAMLPNRHDAEDVFQQTCLILWQKWEQFDVGRAFLPWACGIAHNEVRNFLRSRGRSRIVLSDKMQNVLAELRLEEQPRLDDRKHLLTECMKKLEFIAREMLERCYAGREPIRVIAQQFHTTPNALHLRLRRIRRELMDCMEQAADEEENS